MNDEQDFEFPKIDITVNGKKIQAGDIWELVSGLEKALKEAEAIDYYDTLEILSREASAVASKCGY
jgi:archaellum component FlaC